MSTAAEHAEKQQFEELLQFLYLMPTGVVKFDADGHVQMINPKAVSLLAGNEQHLHDADALLGALAPELHQRWTESAGELGSLGEPVRVSVGTEPAATVLQLRLVRPDAACCMLTIEDVSELMAQKRRIVEQDIQLSAVIEHMQGYAVLSLTADGRLADWNTSLGRQLELTRTAVGQPLEDMAFWRPPEGASPPDPDNEAFAFSRLREEVRRAGWHHFSRRVWVPGGTCQWMDCVLAPIVHPPNTVAGYVMVLRDDTESHQRAERLYLEAYTDTLTGLPNRRALLAHVNGIMTRNESAPMGAVLVDIDHFKRVNDTYGHEAGDQVLRGVAAALRAQARAGDFVARLGGEEFVIVMLGLDTRTAFSAVDRLRAALVAADIRAVGAPAGVTASFGVALRQGAEVWDDLLCRADRATYAAKAAGRNRVVVTEDPLEAGNGP